MNKKIKRFRKIIVRKFINLFRQDILAIVEEESPWKKSFFTPSFEAIGFVEDDSFMKSSVCTANDFFHREFSRLSEVISHPVVFHRKLWEFIFIVHHAEQMQVLGPGRRGLVFGVGRENLPAAFAELGCEIVATDAPSEVAVASGWSESAQFAAGLAGLPQGRLSREEFERKVRWQECDMNAIDPSLTDFDFCWSSCALEHLGNLEAGLDFIVESVEKTLKVGGWAFHTTEFNLSSNDATIDQGVTVLFRRRDFEGLIAKLRERGHEVADLHIGPGVFTMNNFVDTPPYTPRHLLVGVEGFTTTSIGIAVRRGR